MNIQCYLNLSAQCWFILINFTNGIWPVEISFHLMSHQWSHISIEVHKIRLSCFSANFTLQKLHLYFMSNEIWQFSNTIYFYIMFKSWINFYGFPLPVNSEIGEPSTVFHIHFRMKILHLYFWQSSWKKENSYMTLFWFQWWHKNSSWLTS